MSESMLGKVFYTHSGYGNTISKHIVTRETDKTIWMGSTSVLKRLISKDGAFSISSGGWYRTTYYPENDKDNKKYNNQLISRKFDKCIDEAKLNNNYELMKKIIELTEAQQ